MERAVSPRDEEDNARDKKLALSNDHVKSESERAPREMDDNENRVRASGLAALLNEFRDE